MKLADTRGEYYFYTGKVSDVVRSLGLAGIAVIWIFRKDMGGRESVPFLLVCAGVFIVLGLATDLLHYVVGAYVWDKFNSAKEQELMAEKGRLEKKSPAKAADFDVEEEDFEAPASINKRTKSFFWLKGIFILVGYTLIFFFLLTRLGFYF